MFTELNPHIFFGGDSVAFWGPLSWTIIFGLSFATFLTLILVPAMLLLTEKFKGRIIPGYNPNKAHGHYADPIAEEGETAVEAV
jgi:multidrug efflux pump